MIASRGTPLPFTFHRTSARLAGSFKIEGYTKCRCTQRAKLVKRLRDRLKPPATFTLDALSARWMTGWKELTDRRGRALSGHRSTRMRATPSKAAYRVVGIFSSEPRSDSYRLFPPPKECKDVCAF